MSLLRKCLALDATRFMLALFLVAFAARLVATLLMRDLWVGPTSYPSGDDYQFNEIAVSLAQGKGYAFADGRVTSFRAPGFPFFLGAFYKIFGVSIPFARILLCVLGAASVVLGYLIARELLVERYARGVGAAFAFYIGNVYVALDFNSENIFIPVLAAAILAMLRYLATGRMTLLLLVGVLIGYGVLVRPFTLLIIPLWLLAVLWRERLGARALSGLLFLVVPTIVLLTPWAMRNQAVHKHFVPFTTNGGSTFYGSNNDLVSSLSRPRLLGDWVSTTELPGRKEIEAQPTEYLHDRHEWELGKQWVRDNITKMPFLVMMKVVRLGLGLPVWDSGGLPYYLLRALGYYPVLLLMLIGIWQCLARRELWAPTWFVLHGTVLATVVVAMIFAGMPRFRDANVMVMMIYAVIGLSWLLQRAGWSSGVPWLPAPLAVAAGHPGLGARRDGSNGARRLT